MSVSNLRLNLEGKSGAYSWSISFNGNKPLMHSRPFKTKKEMKDTLVMCLQIIQQDGFEVYDYCDDNNPPIEQSEVVSIIKRPGKSLWEVVSLHGWVLQVSGDECPCKKGEVMARFEKQVQVGVHLFSIEKSVPSPCSCHVYVVKPCKELRGEPESVLDEARRGKNR